MLHVILPPQEPFANSASRPDDEPARNKPPCALSSVTRLLDMPLRDHRLWQHCSRGGRADTTSADTTSAPDRSGTLDDKLSVATLLSIDNEPAPGGGPGARWRRRTRAVRMVCAGGGCEVPPPPLCMTTADEVSARKSGALDEKMNKKHKKKKVLMLISDTGGGHRASAQAIEAMLEQVRARARHRRHQPPSPPTHIITHTDTNTIHTTNPPNHTPTHPSTTKLTHPHTPGDPPGGPRGESPRKFHGGSPGGVQLQGNL